MAGFVFVSAWSYRRSSPGPGRRSRRPFNLQRIGGRTCVHGGPLHGDATLVPPNWQVVSRNLCSTCPMAEWSFLTNHARALVCIARDPGVRLRDIAAVLDVTERRAFGIVTDLTEAGYVLKEKDGRRNRYRIQDHMPLPTTIGRELTIGEVLGVLVDRSTTPAAPLPGPGRRFEPAHPEHCSAANEVGQTRPSASTVPGVCHPSPTPLSPRDALLSSDSRSKGCPRALLVLFASGPVVVGAAIAYSCVRRSRSCANFRVPVAVPIRFRPRGRFRGWLVAAWPLWVRRMRLERWSSSSVFAGQVSELLELAEEVVERLFGHAGLGGELQGALVLGAGVLKHVRCAATRSVKPRSCRPASIRSRTVSNGHPQQRADQRRRQRGGLRIG